MRAILGLKFVEICVVVRGDACHSVNHIHMHVVEENASSPTRDSLITKKVLYAVNAFGRLIASVDITYPTSGWDSRTPERQSRIE